MSKIDVIMPTYNQKEFLDRSINGILDQDFKDFSYIIVEDGSKDGTFQILDEKYSNIDSRIKIIHNKINMGLPASLNIGHKAGTSPYCTWVSTDNYSYKNQLSVLYDYVVRTNCDFVQSSWRGINSKIQKLSNSSYGRGEGSWGFGNLGPSFLYKRNVWETYNYDENMSTVEDLKFYHQAFFHPFVFGCVDDCLMDYYCQPNSLTARGNPKRAYREMMAEIHKTVVAPNLHKLEEIKSKRIKK